MNNKEKKIVLFFVDLLIVSLSLYAFSTKVFPKNDNYKEPSYYLYPIGATLFFFFIYILELYDITKIVRSRVVVIRSLLAGILFTVGTYIIAVFFINTTVSRVYLFLYLILTPLLLSLWRFLFRIYNKTSQSLQKVLYIHEETYSADKIKERISLIEGSGLKTGYKVKLSLSTQDSHNLHRFSRRKILTKIDVVILDLSHIQTYKILDVFILETMSDISTIYTFDDFYQNIYERLRLEREDNVREFLLQMKNKERSFLYAIYVSLLNFGLCLFLLFFLIVITPIIFVINLIFNRGPLFYTQLRVGMDNKEFKIHKFRTMVRNAEQRGEKMAIRNDSRVTKFGKLMREFRIDELPQVISVVKGDMLFVGPRPERKVFVDKLQKINPSYNLRHLVKPGITGWAQVKYKYGGNLEDSISKLEYDLYYIKNQSIGLHFKILFKTITTIVFSRGV